MELRHEGRKSSETTYIAGVSTCNRFSIAYFGFNTTIKKSPVFPLKNWTISFLWLDVLSN